MSERNGVDVNRLVSLCETIKDWWEEHKYDTTGDCGEWNVYDDDPPFVKEAKEILGDWESQG